MKLKIIFSFFLLIVLTGQAFSNGDIFPPEIKEDYDRKSPINGWKLKRDTMFEGIPQGEPLYPYHAWINYKGYGEKPSLECIFITKGRKKVNFFMNEWEDKQINPLEYIFESQNAISILIKDPYMDKKTNQITGKKADAWNGTKFDEQDMPSQLPQNIFPLVFKYKPKNKE